MNDSDSNVLQKDDKISGDVDFSKVSLDDIFGTTLATPHFSIENFPQEFSQPCIVAPKLPILGGPNVPGRRYDRDTWLAYRPVIQDLYMIQGRPLRET